MSDISEEQLRDAIAEWYQTNAGPAHRVLVAAAKELLELRHAKRADDERVRQVVGTVVMEELPADVVPNDACMRIADRVALQLASTAPVLTPDEMNAVRCMWFALPRDCLTAEQHATVQRLIAGASR